MLAFPPFKIDLDEQRVWRDSKELVLRRKPFAILRFLIENPHRLVTQDELLAHVWHGAVVSESAIRSHLHELRTVLGEGVIETVIGRGYRFTAKVSELATETAPAPSAAIVGREAELDVLRGALERSLTGRRQLCFVTGDPGIGKTTLVNTFLGELGNRTDVTVAVGGCVEQYGSSEAYLAVIELLVKLRRSAHGDRVLAALLRHAPTFLAQVPHLVPDDRLDEVMRRAAGGTEAKMVRELIEAIETVCSQMPLVLVLEDLQWSDVATIDLLSMLYQRSERAPLLVIATSRHAEIQAPTHPLNRVIRTLVARAGAIAIPVDRIERDDVRRLVELRFPMHALPTQLIEIVDRITGGTPLFVVSLLDDLVARGLIVARDGSWQLSATLDDVSAHRPASVNQLIDIQLDRLAVEEQRVLEAAAVVGLEFSATLVATALGVSVEQADETCDELARRSLFLARAGTETWPDGTSHTRYAIKHGLVLEVCLARGAPMRHQRWHRLIAEMLERAYGDRAPEISHVLAGHFEAGQVIARAVHHYTVAGHRNAQRFASSDALPMFRRAHELVQRLPETPERDAIEHDILGGLSLAVIRSVPFATEEPLVMFERMAELAQRRGDIPAVCNALANLSFRYTILAQYRRAAEISARLDKEAAATEFPPQLQMFIKITRTVGSLWHDDLATTLAALESITGEGGGTVLGAADRLVVLILYTSVVRWLIGQPDRAVGEVERAMQMANASGDPYAVGAAHCNLARVRMWRRDPLPDIRAAAEQVLAIPQAAIWQFEASIIATWAATRTTPLDAAACEVLVGEFRERAKIYPLGMTMVGTAVIEIVRASKLDQLARTLVDEMIARARDHGELLFEAEHLRIRGELLEPTDPVAAADQYREAIDTARRITARALELRAATRLVQLWRGTPRAAEARGFLETAFASFTEGLDTHDLVAARLSLTE